MLISIYHQCHTDNKIVGSFTKNTAEVTPNLHYSRTMQKEGKNVQSKRNKFR